MSDDVVRGVEDFTFDVLGYDMATVKKFTAKITFPEGTVLDDVSFRTNKKREWVPSPHEGEYVNCTGNIIELCAYPMAAEKGYTVQVILPAGFYNPATVKVTFYWYYVIFAVLAAAGIAAGLIIFLKRSVQKKPVEVVEFYPPEYVDIMKYSGIWHRGARSKDAAALVLKWVDMGFIKLERDGKRHITLYTTGKDTDGRDSRGKLYCETAEEAEFYRALFRYEGNVFHTRGYFFNNCKSGIYDAVEKLVKRSGKPVEDVETIKTVLPFVSLVPTFAFLMYNAILTGPSKGFIGYFLPVFFFIFMAAGTFTGVIFAKSPNLLILLFPIAFYGMIYTVYSFLFSMPRYDYICLRYIAPLWWALNVFVLPFLLKGKRTREVQTLYGRMLGFKRFLLTAELPRIQLLFDENPEYFSDILPYCLIMGISKKVKKRFAALDFALPALMQSGMNERWFCYCVARTTSHSSFSVAGGGGFSGGGGGGGGHGGSSGGGGGGGGSRSR